MEQLNSGDRTFNLELYDEFEKCWKSINEIYLEEAKTYSWRIGGRGFDCSSLNYITVQGLPLLMARNDGGFSGSFTTPFSSGNIVFEVSIGSSVYMMNSFIYPDKRKITLEQYERIINEILEEANICLKHSGLGMGIETSGCERKLSYAQWNYIERNIMNLKTIFGEIEKRPLKVLIKNEYITETDKARKTGKKTEGWIEKHGERYGGTDTKLPNKVKISSFDETYNVYENRVIKFQLIELQSLLGRFLEIRQEDIKIKAYRYLELVRYWLTSPFLSGVGAHKGAVNITQAFRKHPIYRLWFTWFRELYNHREWRVGMKNTFPIKDTYHLYEIWAFMQVVRILREMDCIEDTSELYLESSDGIFLDLSEHKESRVRLKNGGNLYYQRVFQWNSNPYYAYTQRMIPDIVMEFEGKIIVLDPKYRVDANLSNALAEMHKYRDGILKRKDDKRVVEESYILAPEAGDQSSRIFEKEYRKSYGMGAFLFKPGVEMVEFRDMIIERFK